MLVNMFTLGPLANIPLSGADVKTGAVFCYECNDFIYDAKLDEIYVCAVVAAEEKLTLAKFQGKFYCTPFERH